MDGLTKSLLLLAQTDEEQQEAKPKPTGISALAGTVIGFVTGKGRIGRPGKKLAGTKAGAEAAASNLSDIVNRLLLQFEAVFFERSIRIESAVASDIFVRADAPDLERLLTILLDNASKYSAKSGVVRVSLTASPDKTHAALLRVNNDGEPIAADKLEHIFERFFRGDDSHSNAVEGYGLGLSIAQALTEKFGGSISVTSNTTEGTTFTVALPRAPLAQ
jgi:signal transduction histidine kinase